MPQKLIAKNLKPWTADLSDMSLHTTVCGQCWWTSCLKHLDTLRLRNNRQTLILKLIDCMAPACLVKLCGNCQNELGQWTMKKNCEVCAGGWNTRFKSIADGGRPELKTLRRVSKNRGRTVVQDGRKKS